MRTALLLLVGNRDLQIPANKRGELKGKYLDHLEENNDGTQQNLIIRKGKNANLSFREVSSMFYEEREELKSFFSFPLLERTIEELGTLPDKVFVTASDQPSDSYNVQDTIYVGLIICAELQERGLDCELIPCQHNPTQAEVMMSYYTDLLSKISADFDRLVISNSGGTPTMRTASHMAGLFRGYEYITISGADNSNLRPYNTLERVILGHIAEKMLGVYNYEGINKLPQLAAKPKALAAYAKARIALDFKLARKHLEPYLDDSGCQAWYDAITEAPSLKLMEREMYQSAKIKFAQQNYADYLWRIFTISDNMFTPALEEMLGGSIEHNYKTNHQSWNDLLQRDRELIEVLDHKKIRGEPLDYREPSNFIKTCIYEVLTKDLGRRNTDENEVQLVKNLESLKSLRNAVAHSYGYKPNQKLQGVGLEEMENGLGKKHSMEDVNHRLAKFVGIPWDDFGDYHAINQKILDEIARDGASNLLD